MATPTPASASAGTVYGIYGGTVVAFAPSAITTGTVTPSSQLSIASDAYPLSYGMAFDHLGDLWIAQGNPNIDQATGDYTGHVIEFSAAELAALGAQPNPAPVVTIATPGEALGIAFDAAGNLWSAVFGFSGGGALVKYTVVQLAASGTPTPAVTLASQGSPAGLTFASDGTLWFTPADVFGPSGGIVYGLAPSALAASGSPTPTYTLDASGSEVVAGQLSISSPPNQVVFDAGGNLWSTFDGFTFEFASASLHAANATEATGFQAYTSRSGSGTSAVFPGMAIAFDGAGDLIQNSTNDSSDNVLHFSTPAGLASSPAMPAAATFAASVPALDGTHIGNALVIAPVVR